MAADISFTISFKDDGTPVVRGLKREIDGLGESSERAGRRASDSFGAFGRSLQGVGGILAGLGIAITAGQLVQMADTASQLEGKLKLVTASSTELARTQQQLFQVAQQTRAEYVGTVNLYAALARSTKDLGLSQRELVGITTQLNQLTALSGASSEASKNALTQLSQAFRSGKLQAEEYNSIIDQTPEILEAMAKGLGISMGEFRRQVTNGGVTVDKLIEGLRKMEQETAANFGKLPLTVDQAMTQIGNSLLRFVAIADKATGTSSLLAQAISNISQNIDQYADKLNQKFAQIKIDRLREVTVELQRLEAASTGPPQETLLTKIWGTGAALEEQQKRLAALREEQKALQAALTHSGEAAQTAGQKIKDTLTPAQREAQETAAKLIERTKEQVAQYGLSAAEILKQRAAQLQANEATKAQGVELAKLAGQLDAKTKATEAAKKAEEAHRKAQEASAAAEKKRLKDLSDAEDLIARNANKLEEIRRKEVEEQRAATKAVDDQIAAYNREAKIYGEVTSGVKGYDDAIRELAIAQKEAELQSRGLGDRARELAEGLVDAERAAKAAREGVEKLNKTAKDTTFNFGDQFANGFEQVLTGILSGTRKAGSILDSFADIGISSFARMFAGTIREKLSWEATLSNNLLNDLPKIFSAGAGLAGNSLLQGLLPNPQQIMGGLKDVFSSLSIGGSGASIGLGNLLNGLGGALQTGIGTAIGGALSGALGLKGGGLGGSLGGLVGGFAGSFLPIPGGSLIGSALGNLFGSLLEGLFAHKPTDGTLIRKEVKSYLEDIGASFAAEIDSKEYFFKETKSLAERAFGKDFLAASKQVLTDKAGPEIAKQLQALGTFITADSAREKGKNLEQTGTTFGNLLIANLGIDRIPAAIDEIIQKGNINFEGLVEKLNSAFKGGAIGLEFYKGAIEGAISLFNKDLPAGIDIAKLAVKSFADDGSLSLEKFKDNLEKAVAQANAGGTAFAQSIADGLNSAQSRAEVEKSFEKLFREGLRNALIQKFQADTLKTLFEGMDLTEPIDLSSEAFGKLKERVGGAYERLQELLKAAGLMPEQVAGNVDKTTDSFDTLSQKISEIQDKIVDLANQRISLQFQLADDLASIGFLPKLDAINARIASLQDRVGSFGASHIGTRPFKDLSDKDLSTVISLQDQLRQAVLSRYNEEASLIQSNSQKAITQMQAQYAAQRAGIQDSINDLQRQRQDVQQLYQSQIQGLQQSLQLAQQFQQVTSSLEEALRSTALAATSPLDRQQQLGFLQREAAALQGRVNGSSGADRAQAISELSGVLQSQLQFVDQNSVEGQRLFGDIVGGLQGLRDQAATEAAKAAGLQEQIASASAQMEVALRSIDSQIASQQSLLTSLSAAEQTAIATAQASAERELANLRNTAAQALRDIAARQDLALVEQVRRQEAQLATTREQLSAQLGAEAAAKLLAAGDQAQLIQQAYGNDILLSIDRNIQQLVSKIHYAANGYEGTVSGPTLFMAGDAGPEPVSIGWRNRSGSQSVPMQVSFSFAPVVQTSSTSGEGETSRPDIEAVLSLAEQRFFRKLKTDWVPEIQRIAEGKI